MSHPLHSVTANFPPCDGHNQDETSWNTSTPNGHNQYILVIKYSYFNFSWNIIYTSTILDKTFNCPKLCSINIMRTNIFCHFQQVFVTYAKVSTCSLDILRNISWQLTLTWCTPLASNVCLPLKYKINLMPQIHVTIIKNPKI